MVKRLIYIAESNGVDFKILLRGSVHHPYGALEVNKSGKREDHKAHSR